MEMFTILRFELHFISKPEVELATTIILVCYFLEHLPDDWSTVWIDLNTASLLSILAT